MEKVIVTGANGFIGSSLIKRLIEKEIYVVAIDISFTNSRLTKSSFISEVEVDLDDSETLLSRVPADEYDAFYHFAWRGVNGTNKANPAVQLNNIKMMMNCAIVAKEIGCKKFLCAGTIAEQATNSLTHLDKTSGSMMYGVSKHCAHLMLETYCKNIELDFVWMQFSNIYGPNNKTGNLISYTIEELFNGREAQFGPALQPYDFIYVEDLIEAVFRLGENITSHNCYFIGSGKPRILKDYLLEIGKQCGRKDLIKIGFRPDDGILYSMEMFDTSILTDDIGNYVSMQFNEGIKYTLDNY